MNKKAIIYASILGFNLILTLLFFLLGVSNYPTGQKVALILIIIVIGLAMLLWRQKEDANKLNETAEFVSFLSIVASSVLIFMFFLIFSSIVSGRSMDPTFKDRQRVFVYHFLYEPKNDDVIVYEIGNELLLKRVAALEGDELSMEEVGGRYLLKINGEFYNNIYDQVYDLRSGTSIELYNLLAEERTYVLQKNEIIYLGDNSENSIDSRKYGIGTLDRVIGKVIGDYSGKE